MTFSICFICDQVFGFGKYGGYGKILEIYCRNLRARGIQTVIITHKGKGQKDIELLNNVPVLSWKYLEEKPLPLRLLSYANFINSFIIDADIYYHIDATIETYIAMKLKPHKKHIINLQDPYDENDYKLMSSVDERYKWSFSKKLQMFATYGLVRKTVIKADYVFTHARYLIPKIRRLFRIKDRAIEFMPNPVEVPQKTIKKSSEPTVCFIGRWDPQKRVELFLRLPHKFPEVRFYLIGRSSNEWRNIYIKKKYSNIRNLKILGFVSDEKKFGILEKSWILVNTSIREALPITFLEAAAYKTAILSCLNPDNFVSRFGLYVPDENFEGGLQKLLKDELWKEKGEKGYEYVKKVHDTNVVIERFVKICQSLIE